MGNAEIDQGILSDIKDCFIWPDVLAERDQPCNGDDLTDDGIHQFVFIVPQEILFDIAGKEEDIENEKQQSGRNASQICS